jgi:hypothetical protein
LREDRKKEDDQATAASKEYYTTVTYLGTGALAFFLTIHEKFFLLEDGRYRCFFVLSLVILFLSVAVYLVVVITDHYGRSGLRDTISLTHFSPIKPL